MRMRVGTRGAAVNTVSCNPLPSEDGDDDYNDEDGDDEDGNDNEGEGEDDEPINPCFSQHSEPSSFAQWWS